MTPFLTIAPLLGLIAMMMSLSHLLPIAWSVATADGATSSFILSMVVNCAFGYVTWLATRRFRRELKPRDGILLVLLAWTGGAGFATLPLLLEIPGLSFTDAYFETISGITASGATVLTGLDTLPASVNLWRAELVWIGGLGVIVLMIAILPMLGVGGRQMYRAETPGPMKDTKLTPRITETAKGLWLVYVGITIACALCYRFAGMSWLDAVVHSFTTVGLGGFSTYDASFAHFDSPLIEAIAIVFMLAAGVNFATHYLALRHRSATAYLRDAEFAPYVLIVLASGVGLAFYLWANGTYTEFPTALRHAMFNTVSVATTTGYASVDYNLWPVFVPLWMLFLSSFATCSGSTGGGIKMIRARLLFQQVHREYITLLHPNAVTRPRIAGQPVPNRIVFGVLAFLMVYIATIAIATLVLTASGLDVVTAFSAVVACVNNTGPGLAQVGPASTYAVLTDFQTWVCAAALLLGRLELFTVLVVFSGVFWRK
jgi:trk system potassium uptake protein TrkH